MPDIALRHSARSKIAWDIAVKSTPYTETLEGYTALADRLLMRGAKDMWMPAEVYGDLLDHMGQSSVFPAKGDRERFLTLQHDHMLDDTFVLPIWERALKRIVRVAKIHDMTTEDLATVALRYGLVGYGLDRKRVLQVLAPFGREKPVPTKLLSDGKTFAGQAHFAGTGPAQFLCRHCTHFDPKANLRGKATQGRCALWAQLMGVKLKDGPLFPTSAHTCKYFEDRKI